MCCDKFNGFFGVHGCLLVFFLVLTSLSVAWLLCSEAELGSRLNSSSGTFR